ncbi:MAG: lipopolysaccharide export system protein LptA [Pseudohongiellaceae bacterium]|jgi:lipopolysaccharide export system protein LptA
MLRRSFTSTITLSVLLSSNSFALPSDREQPISIQSDSAEQKMMDGKERTVYKGNVIMTQGSLHLKGDVVTVLSKDRSVTHIIAKGGLAFFSQMSEIENPPIEAKAEIIRYQLEANTITMTKQASLTQGGSTISGERIDYNTLTSQVKAAGNPSTASDSASKGRVNIILEPSRKTDIHSETKIDSSIDDATVSADQAVAKPQTVEVTGSQLKTEEAKSAIKQLEASAKQATKATEQTEPAIPAQESSIKDANGHTVSQ